MSRAELCGPMPGTGAISRGNCFRYATNCLAMRYIARIASRATASGFGWTALRKSVTIRSGFWGAFANRDVPDAATNHLDDRECRIKEPVERGAAHGTLDAQVRFRQSPSGSRAPGGGGGQAPASGRHGRTFRSEPLLRADGDPQPAPDDPAPLRRPFDDLRPGSLPGRLS